jgi:hypothetical protein
MSLRYLHTFFLKPCTWTHSVHARILKPWRGSLLRLPAISSSYHIFPPPLSGLNWCLLSPLGGPGPSPSKMAPLFTGSAHTPLPGSRTMIIRRQHVTFYSNIIAFSSTEGKENLVWPLNFRCQYKTSFHKTSFTRKRPSYKASFHKTSFYKTSFMSPIQNFLPTERPSLQNVNVNNWIDIGTSYLWTYIQHIEWSKTRFCFAKLNFDQIFTDIREILNTLRNWIHNK